MKIKNQEEILDDAVNRIAKILDSHVIPIDSYHNYFKNIILDVMKETSFKHQYESLMLQYVLTHLDEINRELIVNDDGTDREIISKMMNDEEKSEPFDAIILGQKFKLIRINGRPLDSTVPLCSDCPAFELNDDCQLIKVGDTTLYHVCNHKRITLYPE